MNYYTHWTKETLSALADASYRLREAIECAEAEPDNAPKNRDAQAALLELLLTMQQDRVLRGLLDPDAPAWARMQQARSSPSASTKAGQVSIDGRSFEDIERDIYAAALARCDGNRSAAASMLGIPKSSFSERVLRLGVAQPVRRRTPDQVHDAGADARRAG